MFETKTRLDRLIDDLKGYSQRAHNLTHKALDEGRDFTGAEASEAADLLEKIKNLKGQIDRERDEEALKQQIIELGSGLENGSLPDPVHNIKGKGIWSKAFLKHYPAGVKELVPSGTVTVPSLRSTLTTLGGQPETLLSLIRTVPLEGTDAFAYLRETVRTHAAAAVAAGGTKPTSTYSVEKVEDRARVVAHLTEAIPKQTLSDAPLLTQYIDGALREGLILKLEDMVINGDEDTTDEFDGLVNISGVLSQAYDTDILTTTRKAITALQLANIFPTGWAMHPTDWETFELLQDGQQRYYLSSQAQQVPVDRARRRLWGLTVALSTAVTLGECWLADWVGSLELKEREGVKIDWSENVTDAEGVSDFVKNQIRFRAEGRWGLAALRPGGVVRVDLAGGS